MNIQTWFRRTRPEPAPTLPDFSERYIAALHGYTPERWDALPAMVKADLREQVTYADGFRR